LVIFDMPTPDARERLEHCARCDDARAQRALSCRRSFIMQIRIFVG